uniref:LIM zinc finger domain containing 2 n=1 Tax=Sus scrofa TaxID=9823 RepID=A0A8D1TA74_PIG
MTGSNMSNALANAVCQRCQARFAPSERIVNSNGELYHEHCFVCAQCFRPFPEGLFYEFEGRKYCEHDFQMLFAPCCGSCGEFIIGRVIKAMNNNWHPGCFRCELCDVELADLGFVKNAGRHLCRPCHNREKAKGLGKYICQRCHLVIDEQPLMFRNDAYHPDHFNCTHCGKELTAEARELKGELYCLPCHDKMGVPICGACRRPIEGRVVNALGKQWHVEHFVCAKCEKPFLGHRHYEKKGLAYCETHYNQLFGDVCYNCSHVIEGDVVSALNKAWCVNCFSCSTCNSRLTLKNKFVDFMAHILCGSLASLPPGGGPTSARGMGVAPSQAATRAACLSHDHALNLLPGHVLTLPMQPGARRWWALWGYIPALQRGQHGTWHPTHTCTMNEGFFT